MVFESIASLARPLGKVRRLSPPEPGFQRVVPSRVTIPLEYPGQVIFEPQVKQGDQVVRGQIIGRSALGNCIHASLTGTVMDVISVWTYRSVHVPAVVIEGEDGPIQPVERLPQTDRVELQRRCGVISPWTLPGRGFAEEDLPNLPEVQHVFVKGVNAEPTLFVYELLLREHAEWIKAGLAEMRHILPRAQVHLSVLADQAAWARQTFGDTVLVEQLNPAVRQRYDRISTSLERVVVPRVTGLKVPYHKSFRQVGAAVMSVEHLMAIGNAFEHGQPLVDKHITIAGEGLDRPQALSVPIGATLEDVLQAVDVDPGTPERVIVGGAMMGHAQYSLGTPLTKSTHGVYLTRVGESPQPDNLTCVNCGRCVQICPARLQVNLIGRFVEYDQFEDARRLHADACLGCGLCTYVCPAHRPLRQLVGMAAQTEEGAA